MILVDTSVWIDHFRKSNETLQAALRSGRILAHPFVIGEILLGSLRQRAVISDSLNGLPQIAVAQLTEIPEFIERHALHSSGLGYVDVHLLASVMLVPGTSLMTRDRRLHDAAIRLRLPTRAIDEN